MSNRIRVSIKDGKLEIEVNGVQGPNCLKETEELLNRVSVGAKITKKPEYAAEEQRQTVKPKVTM